MRARTLYAVLTCIFIAPAEAAEKTTAACQLIDKEIRMLFEKRQTAEIDVSLYEIALDRLDLEISKVRVHAASLAPDTIDEYNDLADRHNATMRLAESIFEDYNVSIGQYNNYLDREQSLRSSRSSICR